MIDSSNFRVRMETADGQLVQDRKSDRTFWNDPAFTRYSLESDCREKGVRLVSYEIDDNGLKAIVSWLRL